MSNTLRIALIAEGVTDYEVLDAVIEAMLNGRSYILTLLQPESSVAFIGGGNAGHFGGGWKGVYRWCVQAVLRSGGKLSDDPLFLGQDLLLIHLDADVASEDPVHNEFPITELAGVLPCERPCPPPNATTNSLRNVMLSWIGEIQTPPNTVLCTPSKSIETWVIAAIFPRDREMTRRGWECHPNPVSRLGQQPVRERFAKNQADYAARKPKIQAGWPSVVTYLTEARRFQDDFMAVAQNLPA